ncbi:flagellar M-ring protein FliF [Brevundimonas sp. AJA228-03]|uniref:flagellar basal-body MS-ring/collar protein FliF n=1 Tax=Brevundimonas sp. AJA228-03 TaxID=2752515 RepID=UPI001AE00D20|nr:flagellar basal-body MS-ring/collar protein FliF [Brevundimonas sp. AJA228-03]QTN20564.1 flagellar M-ring protein FliF [Brevundimonas sp. AJA228-03]
MGGFTAALQRFGIGRLAMVLGVGAGVAAVLVAVMLRVGQAPDALLYSNLDLREAGEITASLEQSGIKYTTRGDGSTIMVNRDQVGEARLMLAGKGLVTSGSVGYELFDTQSVLGQTEFQQQISEQRALQGELARTIMSMRGVQSARVAIALPRRELFQQDAAEPTASVVVGLGGRKLSTDQVRAIRAVIASSVPNLKPTKVTVVDETNQTLAAADDEEGFTSSTAEEAKGATEAQLQQRIKDLVEGVVGAGAARVQVTADIDMTRSTTQEQKYDPDGQVVRSTSTNGSQSQDTTAVNDGGVTATNNIPGAPPPATTPQGSTESASTETTNYEISNTTTTTVKEPGEVKKLSVAVAVDGKLTPAAQPGGAPTYAPRTAEEITQIEDLVKAAMGYNQERGDQVRVTNVRFNRDALVTAGGTDSGSPLLNFTKNDIMRGVELLVLLVTALLLIFFVLRPLLKSASGSGGGQQMALAGGGQGSVTSLETSMVGGEMGQLGAPSEIEQRIDIARVEGQVKASSIKKLADYVDSHPDESLATLRSWVHEG